MKTFSDRIRMLRKEKGLTQQKLADLLFITKSSISKYEHNVNTPESELLQKIADFFDVSTDYLLGRTENRNNSVIQGMYNNQNVSIEIKGKKVNLTKDEIQNLIDTLATVGFDVDKLLNKKNKL